MRVLTPGQRLTTTSRPTRNLRDPSRLERRARHVDYPNRQEHAGQGWYGVGALPGTGPADAGRVGRAGRDRRRLPRPDLRHALRAHPRRDGGHAPVPCGPDPTDPSEWDPNAPLSQLLGPASPQAPGGPNKQTTSPAFWIYSIVQRIVTGKMCWEAHRAPGKGGKPGPIVGLWPLVSGCLDPIPAPPGQDHYFDSYNYRTPLGDIPLTRDRVVYDWRMSAKDPYQPESVLQSAMLPVKLAAACDHYMWGLISQGMVASTMVVTNDFEEPAARRAWEDQFNANFTGYDNAGKVLFTYADNEYDENTGKLVDAANVQVIPLSMKSVDAQLLDMVKQAKIDIEVALGVPESLIGNACLKSDELVFLADGTRRLAKELVGSTFKVMTSTPDGPEPREAFASWNAVEPTFAISTESGKRLMCNANHPLYKASPKMKIQGWTAPQRSRHR